jgi:carbamoyltransferase
MFLGLNGFSHDAAAALVDAEGRIIAAVEEERFTRNKKEDRLPIDSIRYCLRKGNVSLRDLSGIGYAWHPRLLLLQRVLWSNLLDYPAPPRAIYRNIRKAARGLRLLARLQEEFGPARKGLRVTYFKHHTAHAASAFFASPFEESAFLTIDGRGEIETLTWGQARNTEIYQRGATYHPNSLGNLYSAIARFCGFFGWEKDGTIMALAACGEPVFQKEFRELIRIDTAGPTNWFELNRNYFDCTTGDGFPRPSLERLFGVKMRRPGEELREEYKHIAATLQHVTQEAIIGFCSRVYELTKSPRLVMAGGVALNSVTNGMILERTPFKELFIQPAAHDGGLALGCAYLLAHQKRSTKSSFSMMTASLGPEFSVITVKQALKSNPQLIWKEQIDLAHTVARLLAAGQKIAWFQGRLEYGPRALGNRSILADARSPKVQSELNIIKGREPFRPFAISILEEEKGRWLCHATTSPFMLLIDSVRTSLQQEVPGALHVDGSVRVQTVSRTKDPLYHRLIEEFFKITGVPLLINTSLNLRGEPIVCTPNEALKVLEVTELDALAIGPFLVKLKNREKD